MKARMRTILVTGFEPFGGERINPSAEIARQLHGTQIGGARVVGVVLPCVFGASVEELKRALRAANPQWVICLGQAGGRSAITPERVAVNLDDAPIPDNAGRQPREMPVVRGGPVAYWSTLPIKAIVTRLKAENIPAEISRTAGAFVCNHVFYALMHALRRRPGVRGGFIHVPWLPEQAKNGQPSLPLEMMTAAIRRAVAVTLKTRRDRRQSGGQTH